MESFRRMRPLSQSDQIQLAADFPVWIMNPDNLPLLEDAVGIPLLPPSSVSECPVLLSSTEESALPLSVYFYLSPDDNADSFVPRENTTPVVIVRTDPSRFLPAVSAAGGYLIALQFVAIGDSEPAPLLEQIYPEGRDSDLQRLPSSESLSNTPGTLPAYPIADNPYAPNLITYLRWRGDLTFADRPFCDADNLVLSALAYTDLRGIVPDPESGGSIRLFDAALQYYQDYNMSCLRDSSYESVLYHMARTPRYADTRLRAYLNIDDDERCLQFSALTIDLDDTASYISFRGTGDSIEDWRSDFAIGYSSPPAQKESVTYLESILRADDRKYFSGGHSKGGNLAIFSAMQCAPDLQQKLIHIYNNDGPGIAAELRNPETYNTVLRKLSLIIPEYCIIGKLFMPDLTPTIAASREHGISQHILMSWSIDGDQILPAPRLNSESTIYNGILNTWLDQTDMDARASFTKDFFDALRSSGAHDIQEISKRGLDGFGTILVSLAQSESRTRVAVGNLIKTAASYVRGLNVKDLLRSQYALIGLALILFGIVFIALPDTSYQVFGRIAGLFCLVFTGNRLIETAMCDLSPVIKRRYILVHIMILCAVSFLIARTDLLVILVNLLAGIVFLILGFYLCRNLIRGRVKGAPRFFGIIFIILSFLVGVFSITLPDRIFFTKSITVGTFLVIIGIVLVLVAIYRRETGIDLIPTSKE